jgi:hypothetical protein
MGIVGLQIEIEQMFNMVNIIVSLKLYQFGIENLDKIMLIVKNWFYDFESSCNVGERFEIIDKNLDVEDHMLEENE